MLYLGTCCLTLSHISRSTCTCIALTIVTLFTELKANILHLVLLDQLEFCLKSMCRHGVFCVFLVAIPCGKMYNFFGATLSGQTFTNFSAGGKVWNSASLNISETNSQMWRGDKTWCDTCNTSKDYKMSGTFIYSRYDDTTPACFRVLVTLPLELWRLKGYNAEKV